jgi:hypothetical protein
MDTLSVIACDKREAFAQWSERHKAIHLSFRGEMDCFASLAMTAVEEKAARAALGGRVGAARALERGGQGSLLLSADVNTVTSDVD